MCIDLAKQPKETIYETQIRLGRITPETAQNRIVGRISKSNVQLNAAILLGDIRGIVLHSADIADAKNDLVSLHTYINDNKLKFNQLREDIDPYKAW